jgi:hypothetical protein
MRFRKVDVHGALVRDRAGIRTTSAGSFFNWRPVSFHQWRAVFADSCPIRERTTARGAFADGSPRRE